MCLPIRLNALFNYWKSSNNFFSYNLTLLIMRTILIRYKETTSLLLLFLAFYTGHSQNSLTGYIDSAFKNNIVLQQKNISLEKAEYALQIAKGFYYPTVAFQAGYQTAGGGRDIDLPIGDLLNNVYSTLNQLTQTNDFSQIKNQHINFLPQHGNGIPLSCCLVRLLSSVTFSPSGDEAGRSILPLRSSCFFCPSSRQLMHWRTVTSSARTWFSTFCWY